MLGERADLTRNNPAQRKLFLKGPEGMIITIQQNTTNTTKIIILCPLISTLGHSYIVKCGLVVSIFQTKMRLGKVR